MMAGTLSVNTAGFVGYVGTELSRSPAGPTPSPFSLPAAVAMLVLLGGASLAGATDLD